MEYPTSQWALAASHLELVHQVEEVLLLPLLLVLLSLLPQVASVLSYHVPGGEGLTLGSTNK